MSDGLSSNKDSLAVSRDFGVMMSVVFLGTSGWNFYAEYLSIGLMLSALAYALMLVSLKRPQYLVQVTSVWLAVGGWLGYIVNPIIMASLYLVFLLPIGLLVKLLGRDALAIKPQYASRNKDSFWSVKDKNLETLEDFRKIF